MSSKESFWFATRKFQPPFLAEDWTVSDSRGRYIAEASSLELAKALAELLNDAAEVDAKLQKSPIS